MRAVALLGLLAILNLLVSFLTQSWVLITAGASGETDALFAAAALPQFFITLVAGSLTRTLLPYFVAPESGNVEGLTWGLMLWLGGISTAVAITLALSAGWWVPPLYGRFDKSLIALTIELTRIQSLTIVFAVLACVLTAAAHAQGAFAKAEIANLASGALSFVFLVAAMPAFGIRAASWALALRPLCQCLMLARYAGRPRGVLLNASLRRDLYVRLRPTLLASSYYKSTIVLDRALSALGPAGGLSLFYISQQLSQAMIQVLDRAFVAPTMPRLTKLGLSEDPAEFRAFVHRNAVLVLGLASTGCLVIAVAGRPLLATLLGHGRITVADITVLHHLLLLMSGAIVGASVAQVTAGAFYVTGRTEVPAVVGAVGFTLGAIAKILLTWLRGLPGLALASSLHQLFNALVLWALAGRPARTAR